MAIINGQTQEISRLIQDAQGNITSFIFDGWIFNHVENSCDAYGPRLGLSPSLEGQLATDEVACTDGFCSSEGSLVKALLYAHQWRGKRMDVIGFIHLGTRYYDPTYGRFISPDPLGHAGSIDLYSYASGDPVNFHDPDGRFASAVREGLQDNPLMASGVSMGADYIPGLSNLKSAAEVFTGLDYITGAELSKLERVLAAIGVIPGVGNIASILKGGRKASAVMEALSQVRKNIAQATKALPTPNGYNQWTGNIKSVVAESDTVMYRVWGDEAGKIGAWLSPNKPNSSLSAMRDLALPPGNSGEFLSKVTLPAGTRYQIGNAAPAFGQPGGAQQAFLLDRIPTKNFELGAKLSPSKFP